MGVAGWVSGFIVQGGDPGEILSFEEFQRGTAACGGVGDLVDDAEFLSGGRGITATDDGDRTGGRGGCNGIGHRLGPLGEDVELEHATGAVPDDGLGGSDHLGKELAALGTAIESLPAIGNAAFDGGRSEIGIGSELIAGDEVDRKVDTDTLLLGLGNELLDDLGTGGIIEAVTDLHAVEHLVEGVSHAAADDDVVGFLHEIADEGDLVGDLRTSEDREEGTLWVLKDGCKSSQFLLNKEACHLMGKFDASDTGVGAVGGAESIVHVDVCKFAEAGAEGCHLGGIRLHAVALGILALALLLDVEADVLEQDDLARLKGVTSGLDLGADAVVEKLHGLAEEFLKLRGDGLERVLGDALTVGASKMAGEHNRGSLSEGVLDGRKGGGDALGIGDFSGLLVLRDVKINSDEDAFAGEVEVLDRFLGHGVGEVLLRVEERSK